MTAERARALWLTAPRTLEFRHESLEAISDGQIRVRARYSALSHGTEMLAYRGLIDPQLPLDLPTFRGSFAYPLKYGYACVGEVVEAGRGVEGLTAGDLVFCLHPHQDLFRIEALLAVKLPPEAPDERGVFFANLETAFNAVLDARAQLGETVVIFGQGVVGLLITALMARSGVRVIAVEPTPQRRLAARTLGAIDVDPSHDNSSATVLELTDGRGADVVIEASASPTALQSALGVVGFGGSVVVVSWYGTKPVTLDLGGDFHRRRLRIVSSQVGHIDAALSGRWTYDRRREAVRSLLEELALESLITHRIPFDDAPTAYRLVDERPEEAIQVVLSYDRTLGS